MKIYDVSMPINNSMLVWPGSNVVGIQPVETIEKNDVMTSDIHIGSHTGTHIDAPNHFLKSAKSVDHIDLEKLLGECTVLDLSFVQQKEITISDLDKFDIKKGDRILLKTGNYKLLYKKEFSTDYISLSLEAAEYLAKKEIFLVGTDFLGIEKKGSVGHPVHKALLKAEIVIVEGLDLSEIEPGRYELICLPLRLDGVDGSPARALLIQR